MVGLYPIHLALWAWREAAGMGDGYYRAFARAVFHRIANPVESA